MFSGSAAISNAVNGKSTHSSLTSDNFKVEEFVHGLVQNSSIETISSQLQYFQNSKQSLATDIQKSVHSNYNEFVSIANKIQLLEKDLSEVREILNKVRGDVFSFQDQRQKQEVNEVSSDIDFDQVDGISVILSRKDRIILQCFVATHIDSDPSSGGKSCKLFLFSDLLVMAYKKKKVALHTKYEVDKSWNLTDLGVLNSTEDEPLIVRFLHFDEIISLKLENADYKRILLSSFKKAHEDVILNSNPSRNYYNLDVVLPDNLLSLGELNLNNNPRLYKNFPQDNGNPELAWVRDMPDELDVFIAHREYDAAVQCVSRARSVFLNYGLNSPQMVNLNRQLGNRVSVLADLLSKDLKNPNCPSISTALAVSRLSKLGLGVKARDLFFQTRSQILSIRLLSLPFEGDIIAYIHDLTFLFFSMLKKMIRQYRSYFPVAELSSGLIAWLNEELEIYWARFKCQVFYEGQDFGVITECLSSAREGCGVLREVGVEVGHVFEIGAVRTDVITSLEWLRARVCAEILKSLADDEFQYFAETSPLEVRDYENPLNVISLSKSKCSSSAIAFQQVVLNFIFVDCQPILLPHIAHSYYSELVDAISSFFELYFKQLLDLSNGSKGMTDKNVLIGVVNLSWISKDFFPFVRNVLESFSYVPEKFEKLRNEKKNPMEAFVTKPFKKKTIVVEEKLDAVKEPILIGFRRSIYEWSKLNKRLDAIILVISSTYAISRAKTLARETYAFGPGCILPMGGSPVFQYAEYTSDAYPLIEELTPNESIISCLKELSKLEKLITEIGKEGRRLKCNETLIMNILECFFKDMMADENWVTKEHGYDRIFQYSGLHQYILDVQFLLKNADIHLSETAVQKANDASSKALKLYFKRLTEEQKKRILKSGEWFEKRIDDLMKSKKISTLDLTLKGFKK